MRRIVMNRFSLILNINGEIVEFIANDLFYKQFTVDDLLDGLSANDFFDVLTYLQQYVEEAKG